MNESYAPANKCLPLGYKKPLIKAWLTGKKLYLGETTLGNRYFMLTVFNDAPRFMDLITGTMYELKGRCLSSSYLHIKTIARIQPDLNKLATELKQKAG